MQKMLKKHRWFFLIAGSLAVLNLGVAFHSPRAAVAQDCPTERSDCRGGSEDCKSCDTCLCWECGRDCDRALR